jgi:hypothetical protein
MNELSMSRRTFVKGTAVTAAAATVVGTPIHEVLAAQSTDLKPGPGNKWPGRVVVNFNKDAIAGTTTAPDVKENIVKKMVDDAIKLLTGEATVGAAWKAVFPSTLSLQSKVAIKINILNSSRPAPHPFTVMGITEGLQQMEFNGSKFPAANITIYDMNNSSSFDKYDTQGGGGEFFSSARFPGISRVKDSAQAAGDGAMNNRSYAKTLKSSDFLINVFSPRGHFVTGFSLGFKSHYGTYSSPSSLHTDSTAHAALRDFTSTGPVFNKLVLSFCSGMFGKTETNGPTGTEEDFSKYTKKMDASSSVVNPSTIIMSTDPISCEMQSIKMMRMNKNPEKAYDVASMPNYLKASGGVSGSITPVYNVGIIDEAKMDVRKIINGQIIGVGTANNQPLLQRSDIALHAKQLKGTRSTFIEYSFPPEYVGKKASIEIYSINGASVYKSIREISGISSNFSWDEKDSSGKHVGNGTYMVKVVAGSIVLSSKLSITR